MDPSVRSMLMSGYVRSELAEEKDALQPPEEVASPLPEGSVDAVQFLCYQDLDSDQDMSAWLQRKCGLTPVQSNNEIFDPLRQASVLGMSRETFDELMTTAFAEWKRHCRTVQLAEQKHKDWTLTAPERERRFLHDADIERRREERRTIAVQTTQNIKLEDVKLKALRLADRLAESASIRALAEIAQKREVDEVRRKEEAAEKDKQRTADAEEKKKQREADVALLKEKDRQRAAEAAEKDRHLKTEVEENEKRRKTDDAQRQLEYAKLRLYS